jgi:hypothetical protein
MAIPKGSDKTNDRFSDVDTETKQQALGTKTGEQAEN